MSDDALERPDSSRRSRRLPFGWFTMFGLAWVVYELTHSPGIASVLICFKFGWQDFLAARWIWRTDEHRPRRRSLFWLYSAWGLWKTAAVAFLMSIAFAAITPPARLPQPLPQALLAFFGTFFTTLFTILLSSSFTFLAVVSAWFGGVRLWLDSGVHRARRFNYWPPTPFCKSNAIGTLIMTSTGLLALTGLLVVLSVTPVGKRGIVFGFLLAVAVPVLIGLADELILNKIRADSPEECWPEEWDTNPS